MNEEERKRKEAYRKWKEGKDETEEVHAWYGYVFRRI
jgi:hypothetical protein